MRLGIALTALSLSMVGLAADPVHASIRRETHIPAEGLGPALQTLARDRHVQLVYVSAEIDTLRTNGASGDLTLEEALQQLLKDTGFTYRFYGEEAVGIMPASASSSSGSSSIPSTTSAESSSGPGTTSATGSGSANAPSAPSGESPSRGSFRVAQATAGVPSATVGAIPAASVELGEILVTAQKKTERLQDVPIPVTAVSAESLLDTNQLRLQDYYTRVPGLTVAPDDFGNTTVTIRGISTGDYTNPTVAVTVDDIPFGSSTGLGNGGEVPDFDPSDLDHIEVLRGPQGTLYGASSLGGLIKYVTVDPSTDGWSGRIEADGNSIHHGDGLGYGVRAALNIPVNEVLALRFSGFARHDAGYIDNVLTSQRGVNNADVDGGRLTGLWRPTDSLSLKVSALFENTTTHGSPNVEVGLGDLNQSNVRDIGGYSKRIQAYSAVFKANLGAIDITSLSGYSINAYNNSFDYSSGLGGLVESGYPGTGFNGYGVSGVPIFLFGKTDKFTEELRFSSAGHQRVEWLAGLFYDHEDSPATENIVAAVPVSGVPVGTFAHIPFPSTYEEYAGFADLTVHITDAFDIQLGGREGFNRQTYSESYYGPYDLIAFGEAGPYVQPTVHSNDNSFTYLLTPEYKFTPDLMLYARFASGYRPGGPNINGGAAGLPSEYGPDTTRNYELGVKGDIWAHRLSIDASAYYIDWHNIQLYLTDPTTSLAYNANGSGAKSEGVETAVQAHLLTHTTLSGWVTWNEAVLTQGFPAASSALGNPGDRLPYTARFSGYLALDQQFDLTSELSATAGAAVSYVADRQGVFAAAGGPPARQDFPAYARTDVHAALKYDHWTATLFINNLADKRAALNGGIGTYNSNAFVYIQPRTTGLSISRTF